MFGIGNRNQRGRRVRNDTFGGSNMRNAALAGVGMLAWRWWKNRQSANQPNNFQNQSFSDTQTRSQSPM
jgi:uncharacterized membrane protein YebE (DUF533 family)